MGQFVHILLACLLLHTATPDSESDPDYAVAYDAALAYLKANPFALNQRGDPYIYVQVKVDENRRSSINHEIQDIHLPTQVLKEIQDSYAKDRLDIIDVKDDILDTAASFVKEKTLATEDGYTEEDKLVDVTGYTKKDTLNKEDVFVAEDTLDALADTVADDTFDPVGSYVARDTLDTSFIDVQLPYNQAEPYVDIQVPHQPYLYQHYTYHSSPKPYTHQQNSYIHQQNPYAHDGVPYVHDGVPYVHDEVPYGHNEEPYVHDEESYVHDEKAFTHKMTPFVDVGMDSRPTNAREMTSLTNAREMTSLTNAREMTSLTNARETSFVDVGMDSRTPRTLSEANYAAGSNPYVDIQLTLRVPYDELESPSQHFADPALEFAYRTQQTQPRGQGPAIGGQTYNSAPVYGNNQYEDALNDFASLQDLVNSVQWQRS